MEKKEFILLESETGEKAFVVLDDIVGIKLECDETITVKCTADDYEKVIKINNLPVNNFEEVYVAINSNMNNK